MQTLGGGPLPLCGSSITELRKGNSILLFVESHYWDLIIALLTLIAGVAVGAVGNRLFRRRR